MNTYDHCYLLTDLEEGLEIETIEIKINKNGTVCAVCISGKPYQDQYLIDASIKIIGKYEMARIRDLASQFFFEQDIESRTGSELTRFWREDQEVGDGA